MEKDDKVPVSVRFSRPQLILLDEFRGALSRTDFIRLRTIGEEAKPIVTRVKYPIKDYQTVATLLAKLGQSRLSSNVHQLTKQGFEQDRDTGAHVQEALLAAARDISDMRALLLQALGLEFMP